MKRFVCEQNIAHFQKLLSETSDPAVRRTLQSLLASAKRELAILSSNQSGVDATPFGYPRRRLVDPSTIRRQLRPEFDSSPHPYMLVDPGPGLQIVDVNDAYAAATFTNRDDVIGKSLFEIFPDNPDDPLADGVTNLYNSLRTVAKTGRPHARPVQRYDIRDRSGRFIERYWQPITTPIHDEEGRLVFLLHQVEDVTDQVKP